MAVLSGKLIVDKGKVCEKVVEACMAVVIFDALSLSQTPDAAVRPLAQ